MSLIYTESFGAFGRFNGSDAFDPAVGGSNQARAAYTANLARAGYQVVTASNAAADSSGGFMVRPDPVYPDRAALVQSSAAGSAINLGVSAAFRKEMPITDKQIIVGFSIFVPAEYVANISNSTVPVFRMNASIKTDATWSAIGVVIASAKEAFRITNDLSIRWGADAAQSSRKLVAGQMNYLEVRISANEVSVWLDDVFVMQKIVSLIPQSLGFIFENNANAGVGGTNMSNLPGRWAVGNMYFLAVDGITPQVRLGPTTRVIPQRPDTDVDVRFIRPVGYDTNAAVAAQDLVDQPSAQLQSTTVGDFDMYQTVGGGSGDAIRTMGMVHAVAVKALAQNLEPEVHQVRPFVKYGVSAAEGADTKLKDMVLITSPTTKTIRGMCVVPQDNSVIIFGDGEMMWRSGPNFDTSTWTRISETGAAFNFTAAWVRSDGGILFTSYNGTALANAGYLYWYDPNIPTVLNKGIALPAYAMNGGAGIILSPDGSRLIIPNADNTGAGTAVQSAQTFSTVGHNSASPHTASYTNATWAVTPTSPVLATGGWAGSASKPDWSTTMVMPGASNQDTAYRIASGTGMTLTQVAHNLTGVNFRCATWDGVQWLMAQAVSSYTSGAPYIFNSPDGATWGPPTPIGNSGAGANQILRFGKSNLSNQESIFGGDGGALTMSLDGRNWRQMPRITTQPLYAAVVAANGDFIIGGGAGVLIRIKTLGADTALQPLAGYQMAFGSAAFNPATAAPWTPAQAADAKFGVKLTT